MHLSVRLLAQRLLRRRRVAPGAIPEHEWGQWEAVARARLGCILEGLRGVSWSRELQVEASQPDSGYSTNVTVDVFSWPLSAPVLELAQLALAALRPGPGIGAR